MSWRHFKKLPRGAIGADGLIKQSVEVAWRLKNMKKLFSCERTLITLTHTNHCINVKSNRNSNYNLLTRQLLENDIKIQWDMKVYNLKMTSFRSMAVDQNKPIKRTELGSERRGWLWRNSKYDRYKKNIFFVLLEVWLLYKPIYPFVVWLFGWMVGWSVDENTIKEQGSLTSIAP